MIEDPPEDAILLDEYDKPIYETSRVTINDEGGDPYETGLASEFGTIDIDNPNESHTGAWDNDITSPDIAGVALPASTLASRFGNPKDAFGAMVEVQIPGTGQTGVFPVVDIGPGDSVLNRQGPTIDLTAGAVSQLGHSGGLDKAKWRFVDDKPQGDVVSDPPEGSTPLGGSLSQPASARQEQTEIVTDPPEGTTLLKEIDSNIAKFEGLKPEVQSLATDFLGRAQEWAKANGLEVRVTEGYRTPERQAELYAQGRTAPGPIVTNAKPGQSNHQSARAFDVGIYKDGKEIEDDKLWHQLGQIGKDTGLSWGGDFKSIYDPNHFELLGDRPKAAPGTDYQETGGPVIHDPPPGSVPLEPASNVPLGERQMSDQELVEVRGAQPTGEPQVRKPGTLPEGPIQTSYTQVTGKGQAVLPRMTELEADRLGLKAWIDRDTGEEVRRGTYMGKGTGLSREQFEKKYGPNMPETFVAEGEQAAAAGEPIVASGEKGHPVLSKFEQGVEERMGGSGYVTELGQRAVKEGAGGVIKAAKGIRTGELAAGEALHEYTENPYSRTQDPVAFAKADIPRLHQELDAQRAKVASMRTRGYGPESQETKFRYGVGPQGQKAEQSIYQEEMKKEGDLVRRLRQAEDAANGNLGQETYSDKIIRAAADQMVAEGKRSLPEINAKINTWEKKWAPYLDKKWDSDEGIQFVENMSANAGPILSNLANPLFGGLMMYGQNAEANEKEITEKLKKAGKPVDEEAVRKEASLRAVDQTVMEYPGQIFMTKFLGKTIRNLPANWSKQTAAVQGKWAREAAEDFLPELVQETLVTTPTQDLISRQRNEAMGISKPLTHEEAQRVTLASMGQAGLQTLGLGAAGATTTKVSEAVGEARAEGAKAKIAQQAGPTFSQKQEAEKAKMKPGTYRNFAQIPTELPGAPSKTSINVGLNLGDRENALTTDVIHKALADAGVKVVTSEIKNSSYGEPTAVISIARPMNADQAHAVSTQLGQEAIAQKTGEFAPALYGREAGKWGPYKEEGYVSPTEPVTTATTGTQTTQKPGQAPATVPGLTADATPLKGAPTSVPFKGGGTITTGPTPELRNSARNYMNQRKQPYTPPVNYVKVNPEDAKATAKAYEEMLDINDPKATPAYKAEVKKSYDAFKAETRAQYDQLVKDGYSFSFHPEGTDPYRLTPQFAVQDVKKNKNMSVFPTEQGFGTKPTGTATHPLLEDTGLVWGQRSGDGKFVTKPVTYNDLFRAVHDVYGHAKEGVGFRADGEDNAYLSHSAMYSPEARKAMASETRGQNSWVNYGPHGRYNRAATGERTWFAPQKAGLLPQEHVERGVAEATAAAPAAPTPKAAPAAAAPAPQAARPGPTTTIPPVPQVPPKVSVAPAPEEEGPTTEAERQAKVAGYEEKRQGKGTPQAEPSGVRKKKLKEKTLKTRNKEKGKRRTYTKDAEGGGTIGVDRAGRKQRFQYADNEHQQIYIELEDMTDEEFWDESHEILDKYEKEFAKLPNDGIEQDYDYPGTAAVGFEQDGRITFVYNPTAVTARELVAQKKGLKPMKVTNTIIGEEQTHLAWVHSLRADWIKGGKDGIFTRYVREQIMDLARDMRQAIERAPAEERDALYQALADSENIYQVPFEIPSADRINRGKQILEDIESEVTSWKPTLQFGAEFLRQARQVQKNGAITEETRKTIFRTIGAWVDKALKRIYKTFPGIQEGKYGTLVQEHLQRIEDVLAGKDVVAHEPVTIQRGGKYRMGEEEAGEMGAEKIDAPLKRSMDRLRQMAKDFEKWKTWYEDFDKFLDSILGDNKEYKPLVKDFMASLSVMTGIKPNVEQTIAALREFVETGTVTKKSVGFPAAAKLPNLQKAMAGQKLGGPKIGPFGAALQGDRGAAAVDRHVAMVLFRTRSPSDAQIRKGQEVARQIAGELGWDTREVQAAWWAAGKELFGARGKAAETYEQYLKQYKDELNAILTKDREGKGRGLQVVRRLPEGARQEAGPKGDTGGIRKGERKRGEEEGGVIGAEPGERPRPEPGPRVSPFFHYGSHKEAAFKAREEFREQWESGAHPVVRAVKGAKFAFDEYMYERLHINTDAFYQSTQQKFNEMGLGFVSDAMRKHIDRRSALAGKYGEMIHRARMSVPPWQRKQADTEYGKYWRLNQTKGREASDRYYRDEMSPGGKKFVDVSQKVYPQLGAYAANMRPGLKIKNSETGRWEDFQEYKSSFKDYHPHRLQEKFRKAIDDPDAFPAAYNEMMDIMQGEGLTKLQAKEKLTAYKQADADNGFFGSLERKRVADLPSNLYDYSFAGLTDYVASFADRISQVEAYGQGKGKDNTGTVWDEAVRRAGNEETRGFIRDVMNQAYGQKAKTKPEKAMMTLGNLLSGLQLGHQVSAIRNLISGEAMNMSNLSFLKWGRTLPSGVSGFGKDVYERGILQRDFFNLMHDGEQHGGTGKIAKGVQAFTKGALKYGSQTAAEAWVRGHGVGNAKLFLRDAIKNFEKNPRSRASREALSYFKHLGFEGTEGQDLIAEGGEGELFDRYLRESVVDVQGGYTFNRLPLFMSTPAGKIFGKYGPWGLEQLNRMQNRVTKPAIRAITLGRLYPETVKFVNEHGEQETMSVPGSLMPLARYIIALGLGGWATEEVMEFFGIQKRTATLAQILAKLSRGEMEALTMFAEKSFMYLVSGGAGGTLGTTMQTGMDAVNRSRGKNPLNAPAISFIDDAAYTARDIMDQGNAEGAARSVAEWMKRNVGAVRTVTGLANMPGRIDNAWSAPIPYLRKQAALQDANWLKGFTRRYDKEHGVKQPLLAERPTKTPTSALKENVYEDVLIGDTAVARNRIREWKRGKTAEEKEAIDDQVKDTLRSRAPIRVGGSTAEPGRLDFLAWMKKNAQAPELAGVSVMGEDWSGATDVARVKRIDDTYRKSARKVYDDLFPEEEPSAKSLQDYMRKMDLNKRVNKPYTIDPFASVLWQ